MIPDRDLQVSLCIHAYGRCSGVAPPDDGWVGSCGQGVGTLQTALCAFVVQVYSGVEARVGDAAICREIGSPFSRVLAQEVVGGAGELGSRQYLWLRVGSHKAEPHHVRLPRPSLDLMRV